MVQNTVAKFTWAESPYYASLGWSELCERKPQVPRSPSPKALQGRITTGTCYGLPARVTLVSQIWRGTGNGAAPEPRLHAIPGLFVVFAFLCGNSAEIDQNRLGEEKVQHVAPL
jgi:hypothetical protein